MPGLHAKKSPSGAKKLHACPGNYAMVDSLPPEMRSGSGPAAKLGTVSHFLLETCLREQKPPQTYSGRLLQIVREGADDEDVVMLKASAKLPKNTADRANTFEVDVDMVANVDIAYDYVVRRCEELGVPMSKLKLEQRVNPVPDRDDTSGTADITIDAWPIFLVVVDFKNGRITVEHNDNPQLLAYLAGMVNELGWDYDQYEIAVVQPNGRHSEGKVRAEIVTKERLLRFVDEHRAAAERADAAAEVFPGWEMQPEPGDNDGVILRPWADSDDAAAELVGAPTWAEEYLTAGEHCTFCDAWLVCPANKAMRRAEAQLAFTKEERLPDLKSFRVTATEEAERIYAAAPFLMTMIRQAGRYLIGEAKAGRLPASMKFVRKTSHNRWAPGEDGEVPPPEMIAQAMVDQGFIGDNARAQLFLPATIITGPKAQMLVPSKRRVEFAKAFMHKPEGGLKLVPASAPGEAVPFKVGDEFTEESEE